LILIWDDGSKVKFKAGFYAHLAHCTHCLLHLYFEAYSLFEAVVMGGHVDSSNGGLQAKA
jgi:hypothetical protein